MALKLVGKKQQQQTRNDMEKTSTNESERLVEKKEQLVASSQIENWREQLEQKVAEYQEGANNNDISNNFSDSCWSCSACVLGTKHNADYDII